MNSTTERRQDALPDHIVEEAAAIRGARENRILLWASLGLTVPDDSLTLQIAKTHAAVDNCLKRRAEDSRELGRMIARCERRALGAE